MLKPVGQDETVSLYCITVMHSSCALHYTALFLFTVVAHYHLAADPLETEIDEYLWTKF